jgi:sec-independent protein translocase protein TatC
MEVYSVMIQVCLPPALAASVPFLLIFLGQFVGPALTEKEKAVVRPVLLAAFALFLAGAAFAYLLLVRAAVEVAIEANDWMGYTMIWTAGSYYSLLNWLVLGMGLVFEFPLVVLALAYLGIVEVATFRKSRRLVIVICFIVAAIVTPTPDPFTQTLVAIPLWGLFEISLVVATFLVRRKKRREAAEANAPAG